MSNYPYSPIEGFKKILKLSSITLFLTILSQDYLCSKSLVEDNRTYVAPVRSDNPFRSLSQSNQNLQVPQQTDSSQDFDLGAIKFDLTGDFGMEFNDNVNSSAQDKKADIILRPGINLEAMWPISKINTLRIQLGLNYTQYMRQKELSQQGNFLNITPDTQLRFVVVADPFTITFSDQFSYLNDPTDAVGLNPSTGQTETSVSRYNRYTNLAGLNVDWRPDRDVLIGVGLSRFDLWAEGSRYKFRERTEYSEIAFIKYLLEPTFVIGLSAGTSQNRYKVDNQQNADTYTFAPTIDWTISRRLSTYLSAGYFLAQNKANVANSTSSSTGGFTAEWTLRHLLTRFYSHSLGFSISTGLGDASNTTQTEGVRYNWEWAAVKKITFTGSLSFVKTTDKGGIAPDKFDRLSGEIGFKYTLSKKLGASFFYNYTKKNSNTANRSYLVNKVTANFSYDF